MISEQTIASISIDKLKNIVNFDNLVLNEKPLTAILGANGCGKSTILHALACCYKPISNGKNHIFSQYFTPTSDSTWQGSKFTLNHSYRSEKDGIIEISQQFSKQSDRWSPKYDRRTARHIEFIGIRTCVPKIEEETQTSLIRYDTILMESDIDNKIKTVLGNVFNRNYLEINQHNSAKKSYSGLMFDGTRYSSLSMGAGEQRVLKIINKVFLAPKYSLILIDEIDLLLHTMALNKLLYELHKRADEKHLQIIFTTHRETVIELNNIISIRHIFQTPNKSYVFSDTKSDALHRLTGTQLRPIDIFVEDLFSKSIIEKVAAKLGIRKYISVTIFGAAVNCFVLAASFSMKNEGFDDKLFVIDGDVFESEDKKLAALKKVYSGTEADSKEKRKTILKSILQLNPIELRSPESMIHEMIVGLDVSAITVEESEIVSVARQILAVSDEHELIQGVKVQMGYDESEGVSKLIDLASKSEKWANYVSSVSDWLLMKKPSIVESLDS